MNPSEPMEEYLQFIEAFADTMAGTFKQFAQLCREHLKKSVQKNQLTDTRAQLIEQRKKRLQLQDKMKQILSGSNQSDSFPSQQRKRPKNAFALFVADQRDKMFGSSPSLNFTKITSLAAIKWKKMSQQQKKIYQKKFEEMMKLYEQKQRIEKNKKFAENMEDNHEGDSALIKKEAMEPERGREEEEHSENAEEKENKDGEGNKGMNTEQEVPATIVMAHPEENQPTLPMETQNPPVSRPLENILNLFHTPVLTQNPPRQESYEKGGSNQEEDKEGQNQGDKEREPSIQKAELQADKHIESQQKPERVSAKAVVESQEPLKSGDGKMETQKEGLSDRPQPSQHQKVIIDPSVQIIEQIVIEPTIQEPQK